MIGRATSVQQKMAISNFSKSLYEKLNFWEKQKSNQARTAQAYGLKLSGPSGTGKSTLMSIFAKVILNAYGYEDIEGLVVAANFSEKYESTVMPRHKAILGDDVANNANETPNYDRILNYVNTVRRPLEKAGVDEKGVLYPNNDTLLVSTNDITLQAKKASVCLQSILRRFLLDVKVEIRPEFQNEFGGLMELDHTRYDVYKLTAYRFGGAITEDSEGNTLAQPEIIWNEIPREKWNPFNDEDHDFAAMCRFISKDVKRHHKAQKTNLEEMKELDKCKICSKCSCPKMLCICSELNDMKGSDSFDEFEDTLSQIEDEAPIIDLAEPLPEETLDRVNDALSDLTPSDEDSMCKVQFGDFFSAFSTRELWDFRAALGGCGDASRRIYTNIVFLNKIRKNRNRLLLAFSVFILSPFISLAFSRSVGALMCLSSLYSIFFCLSAWRRQIDKELSKRVDQLSSLCDDVRTHLQNNMVKYFSVGASILALYKIYKIIQPLISIQDKSSYFKRMDEHFNTILEHPREEKFCLKSQDERDYKEGYCRLPPEVSDPAKCSTHEGLERSVNKHLRRVIIKSEGEIYSTVCGLMVASNVIMIPSHAIPKTDYFDIETSTQPDTVSPGTKDQKLTKDFVWLNTRRDIAMVQLPSAPAGVSFAKFFPKEFPTFYTRATKVIWKAPDGKIITSTQPSRLTSEELTYVGYGEDKGVFYGTRMMPFEFKMQPGEGLVQDLEFNTYGGLCGAPYIDASKAIIYGFHVAGYTGSPKGYATLVIQKDIEEGLASLEKTSKSLVVHSAGEIRVDAYGTNHTVVNATPICLREDGLGKDSKVTYIGQVLKDGIPMESRARTPYIPTPFKGVSQQLGEPKHRPPSKPNDIVKAMPTLNKLTNPVQHYEHTILNRAIDDYREQTLKCIRENLDEVKEYLRIYSQEEALDGTGEFGLEPIKSSTSAGFPINKSKKHCIKRDPMDETAPKVPREFTDDFDIQSEIDRTMMQWRTKTRSETIFKASSKVNELLPTKKALKKVRKFYGGEMSNLIASKMALCGVPRFMRKYWKSTECMVGINPTSKEWKELHEYLTKFGDKHMIAGDFAGFDTRMAAQITGAAAKIIVEWYKAAGLSGDDLDLIRGALSDIIHPNILFEGFLFRFANGNPSGNLLTAQLNSICNSIMMRYVYYAIYPKVKESFSENVSLATYGDDNGMGVNERCKWFTHTACQKEFEKLDIEYTMADKTSESVPYITIDDLNFLKRGFKQHETLKTIVAPIEEDSILKKFHWIKKPSESPLSFQEQFGAYTDNSFREAYLFGRKFYDDFQMKIRNIVDANPELKYQVLFIPYDEMTQILKPYYLDSYVNDNKKLFAESCGVKEEDIESQVSEEETPVRDVFDDLSIEEKKERIIQATKKNTKGASGLIIRSIIFFLLFAVALPVGQREAIKQWDALDKEKLIKKLYERIESGRNYFFKDIDEAYALDGLAGVAKFLGVPFCVVKAFS
jgi:hypothetical protein